MSSSRTCDFYLATDGKWYVMLGDHEYAYEDHQCIHYGPFMSEEKADDYVRNNHSNPGGSCSDDSGTANVPKEFTNPQRSDRLTRFGWR
jgi:hypothetical protein